MDICSSFLVTSLFKRYVRIPFVANDESHCRANTVLTGFCAGFTRGIGGRPTESEFEFNQIV